MDSTKNKMGVIFLGIVLLVFVVGGYFFMKYMVENPTKEKKKGIVELKNEVRINNKKDYIYFDNSVEIIDDIFKQDVILNFKGLEDENSKLHNELEELSKKEVKVTNEEIPEGVTCENDLYSFSYRTYDITEFGIYASVVIIDYNYNCVNGGVPVNIKSYVINKDNGSIITSEELLKTFEATDDKIIEGVNKRLADTQVLDGDVGVIDTENTISDIKNGTFGTNKALSISKNGKLVINFIVKSNKINYNDSIELN